MTYTTISGDTWDMIAYKCYGVEVYADKIMHANQKMLDMFVFPAGVTLQIPEFETADTTDLPPWMEG